MRIGGLGNRYGGDPTARQRAESFKRKHRVGQKVQGKILKWHSDRLAWVNISDIPLLASINSHPPIGATLSFLIVQLQPEIHLKEIFEFTHASNPVFVEVQSFARARAQFEAVALPLLHSIAPLSLIDKRSAFTEICAQTELSELLMPVLKTLALLNNASTGTLLYCPWILPTAREQLTQITTTQSGDTLYHEIRHEFTTEQSGVARLQMLHRPGKTASRLALQHMQHAHAVSTVVSRVLEQEGFSALLGIEKLPPTEHGGILASLVQKA